MRGEAPDRAMRGDDALRSMVHQLIDVCHVNQRHLTGLREEVTNLRSQITMLMSRMPVAVPSPISVATPVADSPMAVPPPVPNAPVSGDSRRRRVCRRPGCDTAVPAGCCEQFCQAHCASPRSRVHGERARNSDRSCRHPGCDARVPPECTSGFCQSHCNSRRYQVHMNRPRCSMAECDSPPAPGCLVGACVAHCDHWQCSRARMGRGRNSRRSHVLTNVCRDPSCDERSTQNAVLAGAPSTAPADHVRSIRPQTAGGRQSGERWIRK